MENWLRNESRKVREPLAIAVALSLGASLLVVLQAHLVAGVADGVVFGGAALSNLQSTLAALVGVYAGRFFITWVAEQVAFDAAARIKRALRARLLGRLRELGPGWLRTEHSAELTTSVVEGVDALEGYYARFLPQLGTAALVPLVVLVLIAPRDWFSASVLLLTAPLIPLFMFLIGKGAERLNQRQWLQLQRLGGRLLDAIQGLTTLKLLSASRREAEIVAQLADEYRSTTMVVLRVAFLSSLVLEFLATVSIAVVAVFIGFRLYGYFEWAPIGYETGLFVLLLAPEFYLPLRDLGSRYHARMEAIGATEGILRILQAPLPPPRTAPLAAFPCMPADIRLAQVHYNYPRGRTALRGVDLEIRSGEWLTLVGQSGAGKSTLAQLLLGFLRPGSGTVRIGDVDLAAIDPAAWRRALAWIPQRPQLFYGSVLDNLLLGRPEASPAEVRRAAEQAGAAELIEALPQGYATQLGERGQGLSGGEIQRLALARAVLRDARLVVLDEPTASLDPANEARIRGTLRRLAGDRTLCVIAHRLETAAAADRIAVLHAGRVVEDGGHAELLRRGGYYSALAKAAGRA